MGVCICELCSSKRTVDTTSLGDPDPRVVQGGEWGGDWVFALSKERKRETMFGTSNLDTISREQAEEQKALYEGLELSPREEKMMAILDAVIAGEKVINLATTLSRGSAGKPDNVPKVALAPVGSEKVHYQQKFRWSPGLRKARPVYWTKKWVYRFPQVRRSPYSSWTNFYGEAILPSILPTVRDKVQDGDLMLWEPVWTNTRREVSPPKYPDPAILRPLTNGLYQVVAAWDLTPVEAEILGEG